MRILLIRPPQVRWSNEAARCGTPTGLLSIAALVRECAGWEVGFVDAVAEDYDNHVEIRPDLYRFGLGRDDLGARIAAFEPDVIGLTNSFTTYWETTYETALLCREVAPEARVMLGGHHPSGVPEEILQRDRAGAIDFIVVGEGEQTVVGLLEAIERGDCPVDVPGLAFRLNGQIIRTPPPAARPQLDELPDPAWDLMNSALYDRRMSHFGRPRGTNFLDVLFSRGCPIQCTFCTSSSYWGLRSRVFSGHRIEQQLASAVRLGWKELVLEDDNLLTLPRRSQAEILDAMADLGLPWNLDGGLYYPSVTQQLVRRLASAGCYRVFLPVEHPDIDVMHANHKYSRVRSEVQRDEHLSRVTGWLREEGIEFYTAIMIGFPGESRATLEAALRFGDMMVAEFGALGCALHWVHPYPHTQLFRDAAHLVVPGRRWHERPEYSTFTKPVFPVDDISIEDAEQLVNDAFQYINGSESRNTSFESWRRQERSPGELSRSSRGQADQPYRGQSHA